MFFLRIPKKYRIFAKKLKKRSKYQVTKYQGDGTKKSSEVSLLVNQLGLEPRTPSLKGMCSTC